MSRRIEFDVPNEIITRLWDVVTFLETNKETIVSDIKPAMKSFLEKENKATGPIKKAFTQKFDEVIIHELKRIIRDHFTDLNTEQLNILMDQDLLTMLDILPQFNDRSLYL